MGTQTIPDGMSVTSAGSVRGADIAGDSDRVPVGDPEVAGVAGLTRTTGGRAVAAMYGSPACMDPSSSNWCQVTRTASPAPAAPARPVRASEAAGRLCAIAPNAIGSSCGSSNISSPIADSTDASVRISDPGTPVEWSASALPIGEGTGLLGDRGHREHDVSGARGVVVVCAQRHDTRDLLETGNQCGTVGHIHRVESGDQQRAVGRFRFLVHVRGFLLELVCDSFVGDRYQCLLRLGRGDQSLDDPGEPDACFTVPHGGGGAGQQPRRPARRAHRPARHPREVGTGLRCGCGQPAEQTLRRRSAFARP